MPRLRTVRTLTHAPRQSHGPGFKVAFLRPDPVHGGMDPFLQVDAFELAEPVFAPHPHAGFNAVTYILPESTTGFINRDSLGTRNYIGPGALHWTTAGRGLQHEEIPELRGEAVLGLQIFINLPITLKHTDPGFIHAEPADIPVIRTAEKVIRVVAGESNGLRSPLKLPTPGVRLIDVTLAPGAIFDQSLTPGENAFLWLFGGSAVSVDDAGAQPLSLFEHVGFDPLGDQIRIVAGTEGARFVLFAGPPLNEPIAARGPFVMSSEAELDDAFKRYRNGQMGPLAKSEYGPDNRPITS